MEQEMLFGCPECSYEQEVENFNGFNCTNCESKGKVRQCEACSHLLWEDDEEIMCESCVSYRMNKD